MKDNLRTLLFWILQLSGCYTLSAQSDQTADSLLHQTQRLTDDTSRIKAYYAYAYYLEDKNLDSSARYYQLGEKLSQKLDYYDGIAHFARNYSVVLNLQGKFEESLELNQSLLTLASEKDHQQDIAKSLNNIASVFNHTGQYDSAYHYYLQSARLFEQIGELRHLHIIYQNIAVILDNLKQYNKALDYHRMAIERFRQQHDTAGMIPVMLNAAGTLNSLHRYDSSLQISKTALSISKKNNNQYYQQVALVTIGNIYAQQKNFPEAMEHFRDSRELARQMNYPSGEAVALNGLAMTCFKMNKLKEANQYALQSLSMGYGQNQFVENVQLFKLLADIKSGLHQHDSAYHYLLKFTTLQDSLAGINMKKHITGLEMKYQTALKDKSITQQQLQIQQTEESIRTRNNWLWITLGVLVVLSALSAASYFSYRSRQQLLQQQILTLQKEKELEGIKAAMNAREEERQRIAKEMHDDMGAGLTSILYLGNSLKAADTGKLHLPQIERITETSSNLILQMRDIVWAMNNEYDTVEDLIAYIRHQSVTLLSQADLDYEIHSPDELPQVSISGEQRRNIYLATREALHNVIKHAGATRVELNIEVNDALRVTVSDNGKGIDDSKNKWGNGIKNMTARMSQAGGEFKICPAARGTTLSLSLPLHT